MDQELYEPATGSLVIVEAGATVPTEIFSGRDCSDHAVVRQSAGEPLSSVLCRVQRHVWDFVTSSIRLTSIQVILRDVWGEADMVERQLLGRSLLEHCEATRARLTFQASSDLEQPWVKLFGLVSSLIEGTEQADVNFALGPGLVAVRAQARSPRGSPLAAPSAAA
jgi:hypothetical protein